MRPPHHSDECLRRILPGLPALHDSPREYDTDAATQKILSVNLTLADGDAGPLGQKCVELNEFALASTLGRNAWSARLITGSYGPA